MSAARKRAVTIEETLTGSYSKLLENRGWMFDKEELQRAFIYVFVLIIANSDVIFGRFRLPGAPWAGEYGEIWLPKRLRVCGV